MIRRPPRSTRTDTLLPYTTLFRSLMISRKSVAMSGVKRSASLEPSTSRPKGADPSSGRSATMARDAGGSPSHRSEEHTSELQSLMRISYAVFCLNKQPPHSYEPHNHTLHINHYTSNKPHYHA